MKEVIIIDDDGVIIHCQGVTLAAKISIKCEDFSEIFLERVAAANVARAFLAQERDRLLKMVAVLAQARNKITRNYC
ncbi:MAG: hypothetical protein ABH884_01635 [Candidatus Komeilibacteria bacterium]